VEVIGVRVKRKFKPLLANLLNKRNQNLEIR